jgi:SHS2 domain-containing protein
MVAARRSLRRVLRRPDADRATNVTSRARPPFEILEHTADIGLRAWGETREALFENCELGLADILDRREDGYGAGTTNQVSVQLHATDVEALLVEWMNEVLYALEDEEGCLQAVRMSEVGETQLRADVVLSVCEGPPEATELKAATYHQLSVGRRDSEWEATVYFDV